MQTRLLRVEIPGGPISAEIESDPNFPGIRVSINGELAATVEDVVGDKQLVIRVYSKESDKPLHNINYDMGEERAG